MIINNEIWKSVVGFEGIYEVSSHGRIRSLDRQITDGRTEKGIRLRKGVLLRQGKAIYINVALSKNKVKTTYLTHRIVATAFLSNIENKPCVNHKDSNKHNNNVSNLEWCTQSENITHSFSDGKRVPYWTGKKRDDKTMLALLNSVKGIPSKKIGTKLSQETKNKISNTLKGNIPWNKGLKKNIK
ncbi:MAG: HNH endonuclease [Bacteroidia bacterium]|nr:HNH endonuclease [Bacteroidia bacterium]